METTIHPRGRRSLPPVPRTGGDDRAHGRTAESRQDAAQQFVARLRGSARAFAAAAGADTAVVREAVPPARHRRSRCRVVLRYADGRETDVTFLGSAMPRGPQPPVRFEVQIQRCLGAGQHRAPEWQVPDADSPDGVAVDIAAWAARG